MKSPLLTFTLYLVALTVGTTIGPVLLENHDFSFWRVGLAVVAIVAAGGVLTYIHLAIGEAGEE